MNEENLKLQKKLEKQKEKIQKEKKESVKKDSSLINVEFANYRGLTIYIERKGEND